MSRKNSHVKTQRPGNPRSSNSRPSNQKPDRQRLGATRSQTRRPVSSRSLRTPFLTLLLTTTLVALAYGAYLSLPYVNPEVRQVVVEGDLVRLDHSLLSAAVRENLHSGILTLDIEQLSTEIAKIAWVESVEVVKQFPDTLVVNIGEEKAVAQWNEQGYISVQGEYIESPLYEDLVALPHLSSDIVDLFPERSARQAIELFHRLNSAVLISSQNIQRLHQSSIGGWTMQWDNGLSIDLGRVDHLNRTRHAMAAWQRLPVEVKNNLDRIDARYDNGVAVSQRKALSAFGRDPAASAVGKTDNPA